MHERWAKVHSYLPSPVELAIVLETKYCSVRGLPDRYHECVTVVENPTDRYVMPVPSIEGAVHLVHEQKEEPGTNNPQVWLVNHIIDLDTYHTIYWLLVVGRWKVALVNINYSDILG